MNLRNRRVEFDNTNIGGIVNSGIIRRVDELGRIVIPKEIREKLRLRPGDYLDIIIKDNLMVLKSYNPVIFDNEGLRAVMESLGLVYGVDVVLFNDRVITSTNQKYNGALASSQLLKRVDSLCRAMHIKRIIPSPFEGVSMDLDYVVDCVEASTFKLYIMVVSRIPTSRHMECIDVLKYFIMNYFKQ